MSHLLSLWWLVYPRGRRQWRRHRYLSHEPFWVQRVGNSQRLAPHLVERQRLATPLLRDEKVEFTLRELERIWNERTNGPY